MAAFDALSFSFEDFSGMVRLFPLPNAVLFPHVMQPLHIFEPRYRAMLEDALTGDRLITMALLAPGWEGNYEGRPPLYPMACLGRVTTYCRLADGTYNLLLLGLKRVRLLDELAPTQRFREARVEIYEDAYPPDEIPQQSALQQQLRQSFVQIVSHLPEAQEQLDQLLEANVPLGLLTDVIGYVLDVEMKKKYALLAEPNVSRRAKMLLDYLALTVDEYASDELGCIFPPQFSTN